MDYVEHPQYTNKESGQKRRCLTEGNGLAPDTACFGVGVVWREGKEMGVKIGERKHTNNIQTFCDVIGVFSARRS